MANVAHTIKIIDEASGALEKMSRRAERASDNFSKASHSALMLQRANNELIGSFGALQSVVSDLQSNMNRLNGIMNTCITSQKRLKESAHESSRSMQSVKVETIGFVDKLQQLKDASTVLTGVTSGASAINTVFSLLTNTLSGAVQYIVKAPQDILNVAKNITSFTEQSVNNLTKYMSIVDDIVAKQATLENLAPIQYGEPGFVSGSEQWDSVYAIAQQTRTAIKASQDLYSRMLMSNVFSEQTAVQDSLKMTQLINMSMIAMGHSAQEARRGIVQLGQAFASGKLGGDDFRSLRQQVPGFLNILRKGLHEIDRIDKTHIFATGDFKDWNPKGLVTAQRMARALELMSGEIIEKFNTVPLTFGQGIAIIQNMWIGFMKWLNDLNVFKPISDGLRRLIGAMSDERSQKIWNALAQVVKGIADGVGQIFDVVIGIWGGLDGIITDLTPLITAFGRYFVLWMRWESILLGIKIGVLEAVTGMTGLSDTLQNAESPAEAIRNSMVAVANAAKTAFSWVSFIADTVRWMVPILTTAVGLFAMFSNSSVFASIGAKIGALFGPAGALGGMVLGSAAGILTGGALAGVGILGTYNNAKQTFGGDNVLDVANRNMEKLVDTRKMLESIDADQRTAQQTQQLTSVNASIAGYMSAIDKYNASAKTDQDKRDLGNFMGQYNALGKALNLESAPEAEYAKPNAENLSKIASNTSKIKIDREDLEYLKDIAMNTVLLSVASSAPQITMNTGDINNGVDVSNILEQLNESLSLNKLEVVTDGTNVIRMAGAV